MLPELYPWCLSWYMIVQTVLLGIKLLHWTKHKHVFQPLVDSQCRTVIPERRVMAEVSPGYWLEKLYSLESRWKAARCSPVVSLSWDKSREPGKPRQQEFRARVVIRRGLKKRGVCRSAEDNPWVISWVLTGTCMWGNNLNRGLEGEINRVHTGPWIVHVPTNWNGKTF